MALLRVEGPLSTGPTPFSFDQFRNISTEWWDPLSGKTLTFLEARTKITTSAIIYYVHIGTLFEKAEEVSFDMIPPRFSKHRSSGPILSISRMSVCPSVRLFVRLFTFKVLFKYLFAPTSRSRMSNIFRDSESLGKSNGLKWSRIGTFIFGSGLKSPRAKKIVFCWFCLTKHGGNHTSRWIRDLWSKGVLLILAYL